MTNESAAKLVHHLRWALSGRDLVHVPDPELLDRFVKERDERAFEALLRRHAPMVWGVCRRLLPQRQDAEDAVQATFLVLVRRAGSIKRADLLANWLFGVARRVARNIERHKRRFSRRVFLCGNLVDLTVPYESAVDDIIPLVDDELARLPHRFRVPLLLCTLEGMTHEEAGRYLGWPTGTVASRLSRGRQLLRKRLARRGITVSLATLTTALGHAAASAAMPSLVITSILRLVSVTVAPSGVSLTALALAQTVLRQMILSRLLLTACVTIAVASMLGGAVALWHRGRPTEALIVEQPVANFAESSGIRLPANPGAVVFQLERSLGQGVISVRVRVYADGRLVVELPNGISSLAPGKVARPSGERAKSSDGIPEQQRTVVIEGKLSPESLKELMQFIVREQEFFDFEPYQVRNALKSQPPPTGLRRFDRQDVTTTLFRLQTTDRQHQVSWERLADAAWKYPRVKRLAQLYAVDMRIQQEFNIVLAGGTQRVEEVVKLMNERTQQLFVNAPPLTVRDLKNFVPATGGAPATFSFFRLPLLTDMPEFWVTIEFPTEDEPRFGFTYPPDGPIRPREIGFFPCMATPNGTGSGSSNE